MAAFDALFIIPLSFLSLALYHPSLQPLYLVHDGAGRGLHSRGVAGLAELEGRRRSRKLKGTLFFFFFSSELWGRGESIEFFFLRSLASLLSSFLFSLPRAREHKEQQ